MRRFQSHKIVEAGKITNAQPSTDNQGVILYIDEGDEHWLVDWPWVNKQTNGEDFKDLIGGYFVRYQDEEGLYGPDSYESWSPSDPFEGGNTELPEAEEDQAVSNVMVSIDALGGSLKTVHDLMASAEWSNKRWVALARTHWQMGLMFARRAFDPEEKW